MAQRISIGRARFRSPDGTIKLCTMIGGAQATHAVFCKRPKSDGWFLSKGYESRDEAEKALAAIDPAAIAEVDYLIVEREPL